MAHNDPIKVLLVDDHPFVLEGIRSCLRSRVGFEVVGEAGNGKEAIEKATSLHPSVVVMDLSMPIMNGLEATRQLRQVVPEAKVLILTVYEKKDFAAQIVTAGARGYVSKNSSPSELVAAIERIHSGQTVFNPGVPRGTAMALSSEAEASKEPELSLREREVLTLIAEGYANKEAASILGVSVRTIEKHRERIMAKLKVHSVVQLTKYAIAHHMVEATWKSSAPTISVVNH